MNLAFLKYNFKKSMSYLLAFAYKEVVSILLSTPNTYHHLPSSTLRGRRAREKSGQISYRKISSKLCCAAYWKGRRKTFFR